MFISSLNDRFSVFRYQNIYLFIFTTDAVDGNVFFATDDDNGGFFSCGSISDGFYSFDPEDRVFATLANLPRARYRHSSVVVDNRVWLIGGRTLEDKLIPEVDVSDHIFFLYFVLQ